MSKQAIMDAINGYDFAKFLDVVSLAEDTDLKDALFTIELGRNIQRMSEKLTSRQELDKRAVELFFAPRRQGGEMVAYGDGWSKGGLEESKKVKCEAIKRGMLSIRPREMTSSQLDRLRALLSAAAIYLQFHIYPKGKGEGQIQFIELYLWVVELCFQKQQEVKAGEQKGESKVEAEDKQLQSMVAMLKDESWLQQFFEEPEIRKSLKQYQKRILLSFWYRGTVERDRGSLSSLSANDVGILLEGEHLLSLLRDRRPEDKVIAKIDEMQNIFPHVDNLIKFLKPKSPKDISFIFENISWGCWFVVLRNNGLPLAFKSLLEKVPGKEQWLNGLFKVIKKYPGYQSDLERIFSDAIDRENSDDIDRENAFDEILKMLTADGNAEGLVEFRRDHLTSILAARSKLVAIPDSDWKRLFPTLESLKAYVKENQDKKEQDKKEQDKKDQDKKNLWQVLKGLSKYLDQLVKDQNDVLEILTILAMVPRPESEPYLFPKKIGNIFSTNLALFLQKMSSNEDFKGKDIINWVEFFGLSSEQKKSDEKPDLEVKAAIQPAVKIANALSEMKPETLQHFFEVVDFSKIVLKYRYPGTRVPVGGGGTCPIFPLTVDFENFLKAIPYPKVWLSLFLQKIKNSSHLAFITTQTKNEFERLLEFIPSYAVEDFLALYTPEQLQNFYKKVGAIPDQAAFLKLIRKAPQLLHHFKDLPEQKNTHIDRLYKGKAPSRELLDILYVLPPQKEYRDAFFALFSDQKQLHTLLKELHNYLDDHVYRDDNMFQAYVHLYRTTFQREANVDGEMKSSGPSFEEMKPDEAFNHFTEVAIEIYVRYRAGIIDKKTGETAVYKGDGPLKSFFGDPWWAKELAVEKFRAEVRAEGKQAQPETKEKEEHTAKEGSHSSPEAASAAASAVAEVRRALRRGDVKRLHERWGGKAAYAKKANDGPARKNWEELLEKGSLWERLTNKGSLVSGLVVKPGI